MEITKIKNPNFSLVRQASDCREILSRNLDALCTERAEEKLELSPKIQLPALVKEMQKDVGKMDVAKEQGREKIRLRERVNIRLKEQEKKQEIVRQTNPRVLEYKKARILADRLMQQRSVQQCSRRERERIRVFLDRNIENEEKTHLLAEQISERLRKEDPNRYYVMIAKDIDGDGYNDIIAVDSNGHSACVMGISLTDRFDEIEMEEERKFDDAKKAVKEELGESFSVTSCMVYEGDEGITPAGVMAVKMDDLCNVEAVSCMLFKTEQQVVREEGKEDIRTTFDGACQAALNEVNEKLKERGETAVGTVSRPERESEELERVAPWYHG